MMFKNTHIWLSEYIKQQLQKQNSASYDRSSHIMFCIADHFEPRWRNASKEKEIELVDAWIRKYMPITSRYRDSGGNIPKYTFFYPIDEYTPEIFEKIVQFCKKGFGEIEMQLHHDNDNIESLRKKLEKGKTLFGKSRYAFIHGNWSLGNSRKDGRWCGVNNELTVLKESGCYADFTLPSAPSETQTQKINSIYYAKDTGAPKPHNTGINVEAGKTPDGGLIIIQGPLALNWKHRKFGILPKIENAEITMENPPTPDRVDLWIKQHIQVWGRPEWIFIKVHTHGVQDKNLTEEYFRNLDAMYAYLEEKYNDGINFELHYTTAREMYNIVKAAEAGESNNPEKYRDYELESNVRP